MRCPHCKNKVIHRTGDTIRIRAGGPVEFRADGCHTKCHWCKREIRLPLALQPDIDVPAERYLFTPRGKLDGGQKEG